METYIIRVTTIDNLYTDYMVEADSLRLARDKAEKAYFRNYPDADNHLIFSLVNVDGGKIEEIMMMLKEAE